MELKTNTLLISSVSKHNNVLTSEIIVNNTKFNLWFSVEDKYSTELCCDRCDCFLVVCLYKAAREGYDIVSNVAISERLLYQINTCFSEVLSQVFKQRKIKVVAPITSEVLKSKNAVGTGITCGVDSLYSISSHTSNIYERYNLTHLALFNIGSHDIGIEEGAELFKKRTHMARNFCKENGFEFVLIDSNVKDFLPYNYTEYFGIVNCAAVLSLQTLFRIFYSSSSFMVREFLLNPLDTSQYEVFNLYMLSTDSTQFYSVGSETTRYDKVKNIIHYKPSYSYLNVCNSYSDNCGKKECVKCCRTIVSLDILDALDKYKEVFDVESYEKNRMDYLAEIYARLILCRDHFAKEMYCDIKKKYNIPLYKRIKAVYHFLVHRVRIYDLAYIWMRLKQSRH